MCEHLPGMFVTAPVTSSNSHKYHSKDYYCDNKDCKECCHHSTYNGCSRICRLTQGVTEEPDLNRAAEIQYCMYCRVSIDSIGRDSTDTQYMIIQKILKNGELIAFTTMYHSSSSVFFFLSSSLQKMTYFDNCICYQNCNCDMI